MNAMTKAIKYLSATLTPFQMHYYHVNCDSITSTCFWKNINKWTDPTARNVILKYENWMGKTKSKSEFSAYPLDMSAYKFNRRQKMMIHSWKVGKSFLMIFCLDFPDIIYSTTQTTHIWIEKINLNLLYLKSTFIRPQWAT